MNRLSTAGRAAIIGALVEGNSIRATCRLTGAAKGTVLRLLNDMGAACTSFQSRTLRGLKCQRVQCDEIWSFCYAKERNVPDAKKGTFGYGDVWTWTALCQDTKLIVAWHVGPRDVRSADLFVRDLSERLEGRVQITTDGLAAYVSPMLFYFRGRQLDFAQLVKVYAGSEGSRDAAAKYSPPSCIGTKKHVVTGVPNLRDVSTSHVERQNLTIRMGNRRFTRLTNGFSKKIGNLENAVALQFAYYNFCRKHQTLGTTPAVAAGLADHIWTIDELVGLIESPAEKAA